MIRGAGEEPLPEPLGQHLDANIKASGKLVQHHPVCFEQIVLLSCVQPPPLEDVGPHRLLMLDEVLDGIGNFHKP